MFTLNRVPQLVVESHAWPRRGDEELEARLYAELDALQANYLELSPRQLDRFDEILRDLSRL